MVAVLGPSFKVMVTMLLTRHFGVCDRILRRDRAFRLLVAVDFLDVDLEVVRGELVACLLLGVGQDVWHRNGLDRCASD